MNGKVSLVEMLIAHKVFAWRDGKMENKDITSDDIANALINLSTNIGLCDKQTAEGLKTSKKKEILKSTKDNSFGRFTQEIVKAQNRKI